MKRSRIICSIITVIYIVVSVALALLLLKSNITTGSSISIGFKIAYVVVFCVCIFMYWWTRNKLDKKLLNKTASIKVSKAYCYLYLAVIVFVSRVAITFVLNKNAVDYLNPSFSIGFGSYINYGLGKIIQNQLYANVIINSVLALVSGIVIKKIVLNIIDNDMVATTTSIMYLLAPSALVFVTEYVKYNYNVLAILGGIYLFLCVINEVKNFNKKNNKYLIFAVLIGMIQSIDILLGGSYVLWLGTMLVVTVTAMYIDIVHINIPFKQKLNYKLKILAQRIEKVNISKLVYVLLVSLVMSGITTLVCIILHNNNNFSTFDISNAVNILRHSRSYYLVLVISAIVFEIIAVFAKRKLDIKMQTIKVSFVITSCLIFFVVDGVYTAAIFDVLLVLSTVMNVCSICYNREEKIKLLKEKN